MCIAVWYAGLNIGNKYSYTTLRDRRGKIIKQQRLSHQKRELVEFFDSLRSPVSVVNDIRNTREILRQGPSLVRSRTRLKDRIHSILTKNGREDSFGDLFGKSGIESVESLSIS